MTRSFRLLRVPVVGCWVLMLAVLAAGPADAVSIKETNLFNLASDDKDNGTVQSLLAEGVSPNVPMGFDGRTAIHNAAKGGAAQNLATMLQAGGKPNVQDRNGNTPLHLASMGSFSGGFTDHAAAVRVLLEHGANLHRTNDSGETPLHVATHTGVGAAHADVIKALLVAGARPQQADGNGVTALQRFVRHGSDDGEIVALLLKAGANPDDKDSRGDAPLHVAIKTGGSHGKDNVVEALLDGGANPCVRDDRGYTPYHLADSRGMTRSRQALDRASGFDASHAGASGCKMGSEDAPQMTDKGEGSAKEATAALEPFGPNWFIAENQPCQIWEPDKPSDATFTWSGACVNGKVSGEGRGVWHLPDGGRSVYEGSMHDGKVRGYGTMTHSNGRYKGEFRNSRRNGYGTYIYDNGDRYEGEWREDRKNGYGTYTWADGDRYEGGWRNDRKVD